MTKTFVSQRSASDKKTHSCGNCRSRHDARNNYIRVFADSSKSFWVHFLGRKISVFTSKVLCLRIGTPRNFSLHLLVKTINNQYLYLMSCKRTPKSILAMARVLGKQSRRDAEPRFLLLQNFLLKLAISQYPPISPGKTNN